ncbi:MAG: MFS transporter [Saprospiraceae bacterium]
MVKHVLPIIVFSQFCCTSLWFAGNAVLSDLANNFQLPDSALGHLTSAVQFGFIIGTLVFAMLTIADRFSPSKVFGVCALLGAGFNALSVLDNNTFTSLFLLRFATGFCLAGIYPVGMKIAADYFERGLGKSLGYLVGALVLGTAFPHLLKGMELGLPWKQVILTTSILAVLGGLLLASFVPNGPFRRASQKVKLSTCFLIFKKKNFRAAAFGYFGHMWELYTFWAFIPVVLLRYSEDYLIAPINSSLWAFFIIGSGSIACVLGGYWSKRVGAKTVAISALKVSGLCCLFFPVIYHLSDGQGSRVLFLSFLLLWGMTVVADSPMFSTLVASYAPPANKGTALTIVNCIGFAITILSIQLISALMEVMDFEYVFVLLGLGPMAGLIAARQVKISD